jgi:hypothetical protein
MLKNSSLFNENIKSFKELTPIEKIVSLNNLTNFYQLFDITANLTLITKCYANLNIKNSEKYIDDCKYIGKTAEYMSKNYKLEKCFTFFSINERNYNSIVYELEKSSYIKFDILKEDSDKFQIASTLWDIESIFLNIHSSTSVFNTQFFHVITILNFCEYFYTFSVNRVIGLEWPYDTDCKWNKINNLDEDEIYSFENCFDSCILDNKIMKNYCIFKDDNNRINLLLGSKTNNLSLELNCTHKNFSYHSLSKFCLKKCKQECVKEYFKSNL